MPKKKILTKKPIKKTVKKKITKKNNIKKPGHISASQISLGRCLLKYKLMRLTREIKSDSEPAKVGSCMHDIIYQYTAACCEARTESDFELLTKIIESCFNKWKLQEKEYREIRKNALLFGERGVDFDKILEYEKHETIEFAPGKFIEIVIDRTNLYKDRKGTILEIIDYKNSMKIFSKQDVEDLEQLQIYKYIACNFLYPNVDYIRVGIHQTRYNFTRWSDLKKVKDCNEEFEATEAFLNRQWNRLILSENYEPGKCVECWIYGGCEVMAANKCPLFSKAETKKLISGKIQDRVNAARKLKFENKVLEDQARAYYTNKPVEIVAGKKVGYEPNISYKYDLVGFIKYCKKYNISLEGLDISKTAAEKLINNIQPIRKMSESDLKELKKIQIETASNKFLI